MTCFYSIGIVTSYTISFFAAVLITTFLLIPRLNFGYLFVPTLDLKIIRKIIHYSMGNYIAWILETITYFTFPILITNVLGPKMNAYFYMPWMISGILFIIPKSVASSLFAEGSNDATAFSQKIVKSLKATFKIIIPAVFVIIVVGNQILLLFGNEYSVFGKKLLWIFAISVLPMVFNDIYISIQRVENRIGNVICINATLSVSTLILSYLMMFKWNILGVGIAWLVCQIIVAIYVIYKMSLHSWIYKYILKEKYINFLFRKIIRS